MEKKREKGPLSLVLQTLNLGDWIKSNGPPPPRYKSPKPNMVPFLGEGIRGKPASQTLRQGTTKKKVETMNRSDPHLL